MTILARAALVTAVLVLLLVPDGTGAVSENLLRLQREIAAKNKARVRMAEQAAGESARPQQPEPPQPEQPAQPESDGESGAMSENLLRLQRDIATKNQAAEPKEPEKPKHPRCEDGMPDLKGWTDRNGNDCAKYKERGVCHEDWVPTMSSRDQKDKDAWSACCESCGPWPTDEL
jgi:hypothetical protein